MVTLLFVREVPVDADRRIALDAQGLRYPVIVEDGKAIDLELWRLGASSGRSLADVKFA